MVSAQTYLRAYVRIMPQRVNILQKLAEQKGKTDRKIQRVFASDQDRELLLQIIGKDSLFRAGEKRNQQSIRHLVWKINKSMTKAIQFLPFYFTELIKNEEIKPADRNSFLNVGKSILIIANSVPIGQLESLYQQESAALQKKDMVTYQRIIKQEQELALKVINLLTPIKELALNLSQILKFFAKSAILSLVGVLIISLCCVEIIVKSLLTVAIFLSVGLFNAGKALTMAVVKSFLTPFVVLQGSFSQMTKQVTGPISNAVLEQFEKLFENTIV